MNNRRRILLCVSLAMILPVVAALLYFVLLAGTRLAWVIYSAIKVFALIWPVVAVLWIEKQPFRFESISTAKHIRAIPAGILSGLAIGALMIALFRLSPLGDYVRSHSETIRGKVESMGIVRYYILFAVFVAFFNSFMEEYYWRWYVFGRLRKTVHVVLAYGLAGLAFGGHHYVVLSCYFPAWGTALFGTCVGIGGGFWCWLYARQRSLVGCWVSHLLADVAILYIGYTLILP